MATTLDFKQSNAFTIGVELELQLVNLQDFNLAMEAEDLLRRLSEIPLVGEVKPEITQSMIELNSSVHSSYSTLLAELRALRNALAEETSKTHVGICGGGTHPFQKWKDQRIFKTERFDTVSEQYGYLAKQFTVFGQHIHIACENGDDALYLCHALARYIPQFIVLSAASPFNQGIDTAFNCSRLAVISAFPLSGTPPWLLKWTDFQDYFDRMMNLGVISSMKDFYWDIRPKPEYGTVEIRVCDTPLTVDKAAELAAFAQMLALWLLETRPPLMPDIYLTYMVNRFRAARYGFDAVIIDPLKQTKKPLTEDILLTCSQLEPYAVQLNAMEVLVRIRTDVLKRKNDAEWLRTTYAGLGSLNDVVRMQTELWKQTESEEYN
jgi:glutamate---cysteine ligase / carboxylate-amine ligase